MKHRAVWIGVIVLCCLVRPRVSAQSTDAGVVEVTVKTTVAERMQRSAEAVDVLDMARAQRRSADLGEVLSQQAGVQIRRSGGLGSGTRLTLNGLSDDQVRVYYDGIPLAFMGFSQGIANLPTNLVERIESYRGVVPLRFASDALGGAINLVGAQIARGTHGTAAVELGSWGTYRAFANARHRAANGFAVNVNAYFDDARNDYPVQVLVPDAMGTPRTRTVRRFHDRYRAGGAIAELGFVGKRWADKLLLTGFFNEYHSDLQNNVDMSRPFGAFDNGETAPGGTLRYEKRDLLPKFDLQAVGGYSHGLREVNDDSLDRYNWAGDVVSTSRSGKGEFLGDLTRRRLGEHRTFSRLTLAYRLGEHQVFRAVTSPSSTFRKGKDELFERTNAHDPLREGQRIVTVISGLEYELNLLDARFQNMAFLKHYYYAGVASESTLLGPRDVDRIDQAPGWGDSARFLLTDWAWVKASYEYAARLPAAVEVFGNGALVAANPRLRPERSHNINLSAQVDGKADHLGRLRGQVAYFLRHAKDLIALTANKEGDSAYKNFFDAGVSGVEGSAGWTSLGDYLSLDGNVTYTDFRNTSDRGAFADYKGERIPNRPWLLANASTRAQLSDAFFQGDTIAVNFAMRYVKKFFLNWESAGTAESKSFVPNQVQYSTGLEYLFSALGSDFSASFDVYNLANARLYDFFGVQKPTRSYYGKITAHF